MAESTCGTDKQKEYEAYRAELKGKYVDALRSNNPDLAKKFGNTGPLSEADALEIGKILTAYLDPARCLCGQRGGMSNTFLRMEHDTIYSGLASRVPGKSKEIYEELSTLIEYWDVVV